MYMAKIAVALSGGVDSSTVFMMLLEQGHDVFGVTMRHLPKELSEDRVGSCCSPTSVAAASRLCASLGKPHYLFGLEEEFSDQIMKRTALSFSKGITSNPCIWCNENVKFEALYRRAEALGAELFATGHYARIEDGELYCGADKTRDQAYFLYRVKKEVLAKTLFPLGGMQKSEVREKAKAYGLEMHDQQDSVDVCFATNGDFSAALKMFSPSGLKEGSFVDEDGKELGSHKGVGMYTVGQRRGLNIPAKEKLFVRKIDSESNTITLGKRLTHDTARANDVILSEGVGTRFQAMAKIRSQHNGIDVDVEQMEDGTLSIQFSETQTGVTPGQSIVFFDKERVIGGAVILPN